MPKAETPAVEAPVDTNTQGDPTPLMDSLDKTGGPLFMIDQMADTLERARIAAQGRTDDLTIAWGHEPDAETDEDGGDNVYGRRFWVQRGETRTGNLSLDAAVLLLTQMGDA